MITNNDQNIPCPVCNTSILFNVNMLLQGAKFTCPNCNSAIGIAEESREVVRDTMDKFEEMKTKVSQMKEDNSMS